MSEDFAARLADKLPVPLLFDDLGFGHLSLLVRLLNVASHLAPVDDIFARRGVGLVNRIIRRWLSFLTLPRVFALGH